VGLGLQEFREGLVGGCGQVFGGVGDAGEVAEEGLGEEAVEEAVRR
jgi:hypothetical protein